MTLGEYDVVRAQDDRFVLTPGHETDGLEPIVDRNEGSDIHDSPSRCAGRSARGVVALRSVGR